MPKERPRPEDDRRALCESITRTALGVIEGPSGCLPNREADSRSGWSRAAITIFRCVGSLTGDDLCGRHEARPHAVELLE